MTTVSEKLELLMLLSLLCSLALTPIFIYVYKAENRCKKIQKRIDKLKKRKV